MTIRSTILTHTGRYVDLLNPRVSDIDIQDIPRSRSYKPVHRAYAPALLGRRALADGEPVRRCPVRPGGSDARCL